MERLYLVVESEKYCVRFCSLADVSRIRDEDGDDPEVKKLRAGLSSQFELKL